MEKHKKTIIGVIGTTPHITLTQFIEEYLKSNEGTIDENTTDEIVQGLIFESVVVENNRKDDYHGTRRTKKKY